MGQGVWLLSAYTLGMTAPFVLAAAFVRPLLGWLSRFCSHLGAIEKTIGLMLILFGVLIATDQINLIANWKPLYLPTIG